MSTWCLTEAVELAVKVEAICPRYGYHVALTGGLLYKQGPRKDCDLVLYRIGQWPDEYDVQGLVEALGDVLLTELKPAYPPEDQDVRVYKGLYCGKPVDLIFPEFFTTSY